MKRRFPAILKACGRYRRLVSPSPAEKRFMNITGRWWLFLHGIKREYPAEGYLIDFANPRNKYGVEIDGKKYHDVVADWDRDQHLKRAGWAVLRIPASELWKQPKGVKAKARKWLR